MRRRIETGWRVVAAVVVVGLHGLVSAQEADPADGANELDHTFESREVMQLLGEDRLADAERLLDRYLGEDPGSGPLRFTRTYLLLEQDRETEAIALLEALHRDYPANYRVLNNLAWLLTTAAREEDRDPERALTLVQDALVDADDNYHVWSTLGKVHYALGNYERARRAAMEAYRIAVENDAPSSLQARYLQQVDEAGIATSVFELMD